MKFMLINGYINFPKCITKDGRLILNKPIIDEEIIKKLGIVDIEQPSEGIIEAVKDKYFEKYKDAKEYLDSLTVSE